VAWGGIVNEMGSKAWKWQVAGGEFMPFGLFCGFLAWPGHYKLNGLKPSGQGWD